MECLCQFNDPSMNRMSVAICSILAAKVRMMTNIVHMCDVTMMICQIDKNMYQSCISLYSATGFFLESSCSSGGGDDWKRERDRERSIICLKHNWSIILLHISMILFDRFLSTVFFCRYLLIRHLHWEPSLGTWGKCCSLSSPKWSPMP